MTDSAEKHARRLVTPPAAVSSLSFVAIREEYIAICDGDLCAAAILSAFETWTVGKLDQAYKDAEGKPTWTPADAVEVWIYKSQPDMKDDLKSLFGLSKVVTGFKKLRAWGYLTARQNPNKRQDRTLQYRFEVAVVAARLSKSTGQPITGNRSNHQNQQTKPSETTDGAINSNRPDPQHEPMGASETTVGAINSNRTIPETLDKTLSETPTKTLGEEDAREASSSPALHPLIQAFLAGHPESLRPTVGRDWHEQALDLIDTHGATTDEVELLVREKFRDPKRTFYRFDWLLGDLPEWRGRQLRLASAEAFGDSRLSEAEEQAKWRAAAERYNDVPGAAVAEASSRPIDIAPGEEPSADALRAWDTAYQQLELQLDRSSFDTWVRGARLLKVDSAGRVLVVGVRNQYARDMLAHRLYRNVRRVLVDIYEQQVEIEFMVAPEPEPTGFKTPIEATWMQALRQSQVTEPEKELTL